MMKRRGIALIFTLIMLAGLAGLALAFWYVVNSEIRSSGASLKNAQAFNIAAAGLARARWALTTDGKTPPWGETNTPFANGTYTVTAVYSDPPTNQHVTITSDGFVPDSTNPVAGRRVIEKDITLGGGSNLSIGSTATASSTQGNNYASQAIDGDLSPGNGWVSSTVGISWLRLDYGSAKTVGSVNVSTSTPAKITTCVVQYSIDGSTNWTNVSNPSGSLPGTQTFDAFTQRYIRLYITGNKPQINEFMSYSGSGTGSLGKGKFSTSL